jgi:glycine dehydrogenase subunit 1
VRLNRPLALAPGISEYEIVQYFRDRAAECATGYASFLGAGVYNHFRPVLVDTVVSRGEFLTSYTPYQAEISQGTLTAIFEFQTMICQLTGMDVANASMYDGSTAVPEAAMMAVRATGRRRVLVARSVHPEYREVLATYARNQGMPVVEFGYVTESGNLDLDDLEHRMDPLTAAVIVQTPNFFGIVEQVKAAAEIAHRHGALLIVVFTEAVSLGLLEPPADADIVAGELQSFAISPSYGGPYAGIIATREKYLRQMPGRLVGETTDSRGARAFCLTLSTREQHIRREKATSNICTNQALIALMATVFMTVYGKQGLRQLAEQNLAKAHYLASKLKPRFSGKFFNEFVVRAEGKMPEEINKALLKKKIIGGLPLGRFYPELADCLLLCATEMTKRADMDALVEVQA